MTTPATGKAAVLPRVGSPIEIREVPLPREIEPGAALVRVRMGTVCGSDQHTVAGRRNEPVPIILGHEISGEIVELGAGLERDHNGRPLAVGDRVTWTIMASCGECFFCTHDLPQKCVKLRKYGHLCFDDAPHLTGGFAEYIYLFPGTAIFRIPDALSDTVATPANCALATVVNGFRRIGFEAGESALVQGAGLLGLNLTALLREAGAKTVIVADAAAERLGRVEDFGADIGLNVADMSAEDTITAIRDATQGRGVDAAFEVCGALPAVPVALEALRIGGRYLIAGLVFPGTDFTVSGDQLIRKYITIKGIHNYAPEHLGEGIAFLEKHHAKYPYEKLVARQFSLSEINDAFEAAGSLEIVRVAVVP